MNNTLKYHTKKCVLMLALTLGFFFQNIHANNRDNFILQIKKTDTPVRVDGALDENVWQTAQRAKDFYRVTPIDTGFAKTFTEVQATYDDKKIYFAITCFESIPGDNIVESLRRDFSFGQNDNFLLFIDTYNDQTNGFSFGASAGGAKWDGLQSDGGTVSLDWDCKWEMVVKHYKDYWIIEMGIPFRSLQFKDGVDQWGVNFSRLDLKRNEKSSWAPVPRQFPTASLAFAGTLQWDAPPPKPKANISLIPYVLGSVSKDYEKDDPSKFDADAGIDAKIAVSSTLNLDITINPDFSQVEVDEQVTNLDRFELFFPERRRFFLENNDLFTNYGHEEIRPFFSRRIGLTSPVRAGVRLSGKLDEKWRLGLLNMQTGTEGEIPAANFTVASLQRKVFARSNIGAIFVNKQLTQDSSETPEGLLRYNRVVGLDYNLASADNRWQGKFFFHKSITPENDQKGSALGTSLSYETQQFNIEWNYRMVGEDYTAETGFVTRTGYHIFSPWGGYRFFPNSKKIVSHGPSAWIQLILNPDFEQTDHQFWLFYDVNFLNRSELELSISDNYVKLLQAFDPTNTDGDTLATGTDYNWQEISLEYGSGPQKRFTYGFEVEYGGFFNGQRLELGGEFGYRFQPYGSFSVGIAYNKLDFPSPFTDTDFILIGPKLDVTFTDKIFLTAFLQYNDQIDNINTNIRFQWRFQPVSDLFIVYTDNYYPDGITVKNRGLVAKLSYWFN